MQTAMALSGHSNLDVHSVYTRNPGKMQKLPEEAVPDLAIEREDEEE